MPTRLSLPHYRPDLDGLRAVAVLSAVAFHAFPNLVKGGFIGVEIFFVISGYLISTIIFENLENGTFSFAEFYARRIKRIFPALILVLAATFAFGWFGLLADEYKQLGKYIAAGAGFIANFAAQSEDGYFASSAETTPLLHLWSLGVEEQFYIVWPLLIWFAWKHKFNLLTITMLIAALSFYLNVEGIKENAIATFYSPQTRFWELLCGSALAWVMVYKKNAYGDVTIKLDSWLASAMYRKKPKADGRTLSDILSFMGLFLLAYGFCQINPECSFPVTWALIPILSSLLIISAGPDGWVNRTILSNKIAVWFGLISFPLYLWHWPLLSFATIFEGDVPSIKTRIAMVVLSVILAWPTYRFIERPIRRGKYEKNTVSVLVGLMLFTGLLGFYTYCKDGLNFRLKNFEIIVAAAGEWDYPGSLQPYPFQDRLFLRQESGLMDTTLFVGDSNIEQYYDRIDELIQTERQKTNSVIFATGGGCLPIPDSPYDKMRKNCLGLTEAALQLATQDVRIHNIVIGALWSQYLIDGKALKGKFGFNSELYKASLVRLSSYIKNLRASGKNVFLILNIPNGNELDPRFMVQRNIYNFPNDFIIRDGGIKRKILDDKYGNIELDLRQTAEASGALVIDPINYLCDSLYCPSVDANGVPMYKDGQHLRPSYVRYNASFIDVTVSAH